MPTRRYYFRKTALPPVSPTPSGSWTRPGDVQRVAMTQTNLDPNTGLVGDFSSHQVSKTAEGTQRVLIDQYVADDTLPAGPVSGTFTIAQHGGSPGFPTGMVYHVVIRVVSNDGATVRGTCYTGPGLPVSTDPMSDRAQAAAATSWVRGAALAPVTAQAGDRLVVEVGYQSEFQYGWPNWALYRGAPGAGRSDLSVTQRETDQAVQKRAWIEFVFPEPPAPPVNLRQTDASSTSVDIAWDAPAGIAPTGYAYRVDGGPAVDVGLALGATIEDLTPSTTYTVEVRSRNSAGASAWASLAASTATVRRPAPGIASQAVLSAAGLDPDPNGADAPAQQWWDVDRLDAEHYNPARSAGLVSYSIAYGARDPLGKPQPVTVGVALLVPEEEAIEIGQRFKLRLSTTLAEALALPPGDDVRATAIVTDAQADPMRAWHLPGYGRAILWTVTGTGWLARYGAAEVDGTGWPVETVGARIRRILDSLALTGDVDTTGPLVRPMGTVGSHHAALAAVADSTLGRIVEQPSGRVDYHAPDDRRGILPALTLDASEILGDAFTWRQSVGDLVNSAEVAYGAGTGSKVTISDPASTDPRSGVGPYPASISTILDAETAAYSLALDVVGRRAWPFYQLPAVAIDLARSGLTVARLAVALGLRHGDRVAMSSMPNGSPWEDLPRGCFVEGYTESASAYVWRLSYVVSDPAMSGVSLRYVDVSTGITYGHVAPGLTYLDVSRIEDPAELL